MTESAQKSGKETTVGPFSAEQLADAQAAYESLHRLFGSILPNNPEGQNGTRKSSAEVADKALDMLHDGATKTLEALGHGAAQIAATTEKAAPVIWKIMVKQQVANGLANVIGPLIAWLAAYFFHGIIVAAFGTAFGSSSDSTVVGWKIFLGYVAPIAVGIAGTIWFIAALMRSLQQLVNPQYFAARDLINMITGRRSQ